jgi:tetratricopeptide (TPR) repeat protein
MTAYKKLIAIICTSFFTIYANTQNTIADSLKKVLENTSTDSVRVYLFYKISDQYSLTAPDKAIMYAKQALKLAKEIDFKKGEARSLTRIGNILAATGDFPKALETHLESLKISEKINDKIGMGATYNNIARVYTEQGVSEDYQNAIRYYIRTKEIFETLKDSLNLCIVLLNIGDNYEKMDQLDSALLYQTQAYDIAFKIKDIDYIGSILVNLGYIHFKKGNTDSAFVDFRAGIQYLISINDNQSLPDAWYSLSKCFEKTGRLDSSIYYAKKSLVMAQTGSSMEAVLDAANQLSNLYESTKKFDSALAYSNLAKTTESSIYNKENTAQIEKLKFKEQIRQQEIEEQKAIAAKKRSDNLQVITITIFIITFFIVLVILRQKKINPRAIEILSVLGLLLVFEFISIFIDPFIGDLTHHTPVYMLIILVIIAAILGPLHHFLTKWLKEKLVHRTVPIHSPEKPGDKIVLKEQVVATSKEAALPPISNTPNISTTDKKAEEHKPIEKTKQVPNDTKAASPSPGENKKDSASDQNK